MNQIENRTVVDSEWDGVEELQMRIPDKRSKRVQRYLDEMEYGNLSEREVNTVDLLREFNH